MLPLLALLIFLLALFILWEANRRRKASGIPGGRRVYSDTSSWQEQERPLYDPDLGLTGRPDYIIKDGRHIIPVEVKSSRIPDTPYDSHIFQLAAYCLLIQRVFHNRPPYGMLHYTDGGQNSRTFAVDYTPDLENDIVNLLAEMRSQHNRREINRSHESSARCSACGYRFICDQRLE